MFRGVKTLPCELLDSLVRVKSAGSRSKTAAGTFTITM